MCNSGTYVAMIYYAYVSEIIYTHVTFLIRVCEFKAYVNPYLPNLLQVLVDRL